MDQNFGRQQLGISSCRSPPLEVRLRLVVGLEAAEGGESGLVLLELEQRRHGGVIEMLRK